MQRFIRSLFGLSPRLRLGGAFCVLLLSGCGGGERQNPPNTLNYRVEVHDLSYDVTFSYLTSREFEYVYKPLPGYPETPEEAHMLALVNAERAKGGHCPLRGGGTRAYGPAAQLNFEGHLHKAATLYAEELAATAKLELLHRSPKTHLIPAQRIVEAGYKPLPPDGTHMLFQESLAAEVKDISPAKVVAAWKASPDHCAALYEPLKSFSHGSVARVDTRIDGKPAAFWVLNTAGY